MNLNMPLEKKEKQSLTNEEKYLKQMINSESSPGGLMGLFKEVSAVKNKTSK